MGFLSEYTGYKYADFAAATKKTNEIGIPRTASSTIQDATEALSRVKRQYLEDLYITDAQTFRIVNSYKQLMLQAGYRIVAENKTNQKQYDEFFKNVGRIGMHYKLDQLLERIIHDCVLYGMAYVERVYDAETGTKIVDLKPIDAKLIDYVRDWKYVIMTDVVQNPLGYTMDVGYYTDAITDTWPRGARQLPRYIFLRPERIATFIFNPFGNGFEGVGLVEPAYKQITRKLKIEESASNAVNNAADSLIYATVGDPTQKPSTQLMNSTLDTLKKWTTNRRAVFAYPTQVATLPVEQSPQVQDLLRYLRQEQATAGGVSMSLAIGTGESNNKSTMNTERMDFNTKLNSAFKSISDQFSSKILDVLYEVNGYGSPAVLKPNTVSTDDKFDYVALLKTLSDMQAIVPGEARTYAKNVLNLETDDEAWELAQRHMESLPQMPNQTPGAPLVDKDTGLPVEQPAGQVGKKPVEAKGENPLAVKKNISKSKDSYEAKRQ